MINTKNNNNDCPVCDGRDWRNLSGHELRQNSVIGFLFIILLILVGITTYYSLELPELQRDIREILTTEHLILTEVNAILINSSVVDNGKDTEK